MTPDGAPDSESGTAPSTGPEGGGFMPRAYPPRPLVGIGVVLLRDNAVLLIQRGRAPLAGQWSFPGGAQRVGETAEAAARRELLEETGLEAGVLRLAGYADSIVRAADGRVEFHYTILDFCGAPAGGTARAGGDAAALAWVPFGEMDAYAVTPGVREMVARARLVMAGVG